MRKHWIAAAAAGGLCCVAGVASAHPRGGGNFYGSNLDVYYVPSAEIEFINGADDGDGFGAKGAIGVGRDVFLVGEVDSLTYDEQERDLDQIRLGAAFGSGAGNGEGIYARVQYVNYDLEAADEQDGIGGHIGFALPLSSQFRLFGEVGYLELDDFGGPEFVGGAVFQLTPNIGLYGDYRATRLEDDDETVDIDLDDVRVGARFTF